MVYGFLDFSEWFLTAYPDYLSVHCTSMAVLLSPFSVFLNSQLVVTFLQATMDLFMEESLLVERLLPIATRSVATVMMSSWYLDQSHQVHVLQDQGHLALFDWFKILLEYKR